MKTFEQCCNIVAEKKGYNDGSRFYHDPLTEDIGIEAAELYRKEGIKEAVKLAQQCYLGDGGSSIYHDYTESEILEKLKL